ncbi:MAG: hypothetical protein HKN12_01585 [Gemmatimonadetes bacterium]|nr:hypothetical protein [Gemmatimonadota bacterium]
MTVKTRSERTARLIVAFRPPAANTLHQLADWDPGDLGRLQTEYTRLFVNARGGPVAPAEAVGWLADRGVAAQTEYLAALLAAYATDGVALDPRAGLAPDHIAILLEYRWLLEERGEEGEVDAFDARFLQPWIPQFTATLEAAETVPFYRTAARELRDLVLPPA